jgi:hypothetical protein
LRRPVRHARKLAEGAGARERKTEDKPVTSLLLYLKMALDVLRLGAFLAGDDVKIDVFSLVQRFVPGTQNGCMMDKNILAGFLGDETEPFPVVEPFDFAAGHSCSPEI